MDSIVGNVGIIMYITQIVTQWQTTTRITLGTDDMKKTSRVPAGLLISPFFIMLFISFASCAEPATYALEGTWQIEGKDSFERWVKQPNGDLVGESFRQVDGRKSVTETLLIRVGPDNTVYEATVPDQNNGQTVAFILNTDVKDALSFENLLHDFPTRLVYRFETTQRLFVDVMGTSENGFSYYMDRVD